MGRMLWDWTLPIEVKKSDESSDFGGDVESVGCPSNDPGAEAGRDVSGEETINYNSSFTEV